MTGLFIKVILQHLWRRADNESVNNADDDYDMSPDQKELLLNLASLAGHGMLGEATVILFNESDLQAVNLHINQDCFGPLEVAEKSSGFTSRRKNCTCHSTIYPTKNSWPESTSA